MARTDAFSTARELKVDGKSYRYYSLEALGEQGYQGIDRLPFSIKVLLEAAVRQFDGRAITKDHVNQIANGRKVKMKIRKFRSFHPASFFRTSPAFRFVVDLAAMRDTVKKAGGDPKRINPLVPVDLVIDHSVMVDAFGSEQALEYNMNVEFERNEERYRFLRWAQTASIISVRCRRLPYRSPSEPGISGFRGRYQGSRRRKPKSSLTPSSVRIPIRR